MDHILVMTKESAKQAAASIRSPAMLPFEPAITTMLLNRQIKQAMQSLLADLTAEALEGLEHELTFRKSKSSWAASFCVISILCMSMERVQVMTDSTAVIGLRNDSTLRLSYAEIIRSLDERPFNHFLDIFHTVYKTRKPNEHDNRGLYFNPIRDGLVINENDGISQQMVDLVNEIRQIMVKHGKYTVGSQTKANYFRVRNSEQRRRSSMGPRTGPFGSSYGVQKEKLRKTCVKVLKVFYRGHVTHANGVLLGEISRRKRRIGGRWNFSSRTSTTLLKFFASSERFMCFAYSGASPLPHLTKCYKFQ